MCFVNDYDWYAEVCEQDDRPALADFTCDECWRLILAGQMQHHVHQEEYEECQRCADDDCDCQKNGNGRCDGCQCDQPATGETFDYNRCEECDKFLKAVEQAEIEAGCDLSDSRPGLCGMIPEIQGGGREEAGRYFQKALRMFPELKASGYLGWLYKRMF
jgi:hypothetical protein